MPCPCGWVRRLAFGLGRADSGYEQPGRDARRRRDWLETPLRRLHCARSRDLRARQRPGTSSLAVYDDDGAGGVPGTKIAETASFAAQAGWNRSRPSLPRQLSPRDLLARAHVSRPAPAMVPSPLALRSRTAAGRSILERTGRCLASFPSSAQFDSFHFSAYATMTANTLSSLLLRAPRLPQLP